MDLHEDEIEKLSSACQFAARLLQMPSRPPAKAFYHDEEQRMDIIFEHPVSKNKICFCFEPGFALQEFDDEGWV